MNQKNKKALVLVNTGTPDNPSVSSVRRYLFQFLNDKRVIDISLILRTILVNLIIVPFRAPKSAKLYEQLWTPEGSALLIHLKNLTCKLQNVLNSEYDVYGAMRYGNPSLKKTLTKIEKGNYDEVTVLPLFPQYATSTTESITDVVNRSHLKKKSTTSVRLIKQFYNNELFIKAFTHKIQQHRLSEYDHILFSFHGLPLRHIDKIHSKIKSNTCKCIEEIPQHGKYCYKATCYHTSRLIADYLKISKSEYTLCFQSRLSKKWLSPFTDDVIKKLASKGVQNILVVAPSFVADCLETKIEIESEYKNIFKKHGGNKLTLVESLNDSSLWVKAIKDIIEHNS